MPRIISSAKTSNMLTISQRYNIEKYATLSIQDTQEQKLVLQCILSTN